MKIPDLKEIDGYRKGGFRPQAVGCLIRDQKILLLFDRRYKIWQLPQGGIDNKEKLREALMREITEELSANFVKECTVPEDFLLNCEKVEFPSKPQGSRELTTDSGDKVKLLGKKYFFCLVYYEGKEPFDLKASQFDDYLWASFKQAKFLAETISQRGKKRITLNTLNHLKALKLLAEN